MPKFKIGDKVLCKKSFDDHNNRYIKKKQFIKGNYYHVCGIALEGVYLSQYTPKEAKNKDLYGMWFYFDITYLFKKYFYTPQEIRKIKLEELNDK